MVKFRFFVQGVFSSKKIAGLYYRQTSMCQNHIWHTEIIVDEKQSEEVKIVCASLAHGQISILCLRCIK